jgi:hypothetical protein
MNVTETQNTNKVLEIKQGDKGFKFASGYVEYPRAAILVEDSCPYDVRLQVQQYVSNGWITPVAYVRESEYVWEKLKE